MPVFRDSCFTNRTAENGLLFVYEVSVTSFLRSTYSQSGFTDGKKRMQCDQKAQILPQLIDFYRYLEKRLRCLHGPQF